jgi:lipoate-protein ligase A
LKGTASVPSPVKNIRDYLIKKNAFAPESKLFFYNFLLSLETELRTEIRNFTTEEISEISNIALLKFTQSDWTYKK